MRDRGHLTTRCGSGTRAAGGYTVEPGAFAALRRLQLVALFADGTEHRFPFAYAQLADGDKRTYSVRLPWELVSAADRISGRLPLDAELIQPPRVRQWVGGLAGLLAAIAVVLAARLWWRCRSYCDTAPWR